MSTVPAPTLASSLPPGRAAAAADTPHGPAPQGALALRRAAAAWLGVALLGQIVFAVYVLALYGGGLAAGDLQRWNAVTPRGYLPGDAWGNVVFGSHVLFTVVVVFGGLVQLLPPLRRRAPALHRWNGRLYLLAACVLAVGGVALMVSRGTVGSTLQQAGTAVNAAVILVCAAMAWRHARARRLSEHRRWALRLFVSVSGVWFFRVGLMAWLLVHRAPVGFDPETFTGPFLVALAFAQFALPLVVLELFFRAQAPGAGRALRFATAGLLALATLLTALGVAGATALMWWPRI